MSIGDAARDNSALHDEFHDNAKLASEIGLELELAPKPIRRMVSTSEGDVSLLAWGEEPRLLFLHGGLQNAHTWDATILALGEDCLAIDLPGHGRSGWRADRMYGPRVNAATLGAALDALDAAPQLVVGMSLGGLTALALAALAPRKVTGTVIIDVTPDAGKVYADLGAAARRSVTVQSSRVRPASFPSLVSGVAATQPHRPDYLVRRGVWHNTRPVGEDERLRVWRADRFVLTAEACGQVWEDIAVVRAPVLLVRSPISPFVTDDGVATWQRLCPQLRTVWAPPRAGHSVQSDVPVWLAGVVRSVL